MKKRKYLKRKENFLKREYRLSFNYINESRNFIFAIIGIFLLFALFGFFVAPPEAISVQIMDFIKDLIEKTKDLNQGEMIWFIFFNNLQSSFFGLFLGWILGMFSVFFAILNGYILGVVSSMVVASEGYLTLTQLLPHGIFELPAIFISLGLGLKFGSFIFRKKKSEAFRNYLWNSVRTFLLVVVPLLIVAAIIEGSLIILSKG